MARVIGESPQMMKQAGCRKCGALIEYAIGEVRNLWSGTDYGGGPDGADGITCPRCGEDIITRRW